MKIKNKNQSTERCFAISAEFIKVERVPDLLGIKERKVTQTVLGYRYADDKETAINSFMQDKAEKFPGYQIDEGDIVTVEILPKNS